MKELVETFYDLSILEEQQTVPEKEKFNISNMLIKFNYGKCRCIRKGEYFTRNKSPRLFNIRIF